MKSIPTPVIPLLAVLCLVIPATLRAADPITNPVEKKIGPADFRVDLQPVASGLGSPVWLTHANDKSGRLFVADQKGQVRVIKDGKMLGTPYLDVSDQLIPLRKGFDERGLLGLAFHPGFTDPKSAGYRKLYTYQSEPISTRKKPHFTVDLTIAGTDQKLPADHQSVVAEWTVDSVDAMTVDKSTKRVVLRFDQPQFNHDGGCIVFGSDEMLYIAVGDGGAANDLGPGHSEGGNGQDTENILGTILRIDPTGTKGKKKFDGAYAVPFDNPKYNAGCCAEEAIAVGMRNPWRMSFDHDTGKLIVGDIGQEHIEEINIVDPKVGGNFGWPIKEGPYFFHQTAPKGKNITAKPAEGQIVPDDLIDPVAFYDHDEGISIIGGFNYRGSAFKHLKGRYVFGEWRLMEVTTLPNGKRKRKPLGGRLFVTDLYKDKPVIREIMIGKDGGRMGTNLTGIGEGPDGELYVLTNTTAGPLGNGGKVWKIVPVE